MVKTKPRRRDRSGGRNRSKPYGRGYRRQLAELVVATGWAPTFYGESFDSRDLQTIIRVLNDQNKKGQK
jgi:hypothetical protein